MAGDTDFAVHTRGACLSCALCGHGCECFECGSNGLNKKGTAKCGLGSLKFPMLSSCHWNTIIVCSRKTSQGEEDGDSVQ